MRDRRSICLAVPGHGLGEGRCLRVIGSSDNLVLYSIWKCQLLSCLNWLVTPAGLDTASHEPEKNLSTCAKIMILFFPPTVFFSLNRMFLSLPSFAAVHLFLTTHPYCCTNVFLENSTSSSGLFCFQDVILKYSVCTPAHPGCDEREKDRCCCNSCWSHTELTQSCKPACRCDMLSFTRAGTETLPTANTVLLFSHALDFGTWPWTTGVIVNHLPP